MVENSKKNYSALKKKKKNIAFLSNLSYTYIIYESEETQRKGEYNVGSHSVVNHNRISHEKNRLSMSIYRTVQILFD